MKTAHKLSERQIKGTLSAQKQKVKTAKVVLTRNDVDYWPVLDSNQREKLSEIIQGIYSNEKSFINIGLQSTLRLVNNGNAHFLIIANEFSPRFCAKHLISSALQINPNTKVFIVENLKEFTKNLLKVPSIIFSISKSLESTELNDFYEHLNVHNEWLRNYRRIQPNINHVIEKKKSKKIEIEPKITIIEKSQDKKPDINVENMKNDISSDFISFSNNSTSIYKPIKMRKVLGNPNRKTGKKRL